MVLVDPTKGLSAKMPRGFTGQTLTIEHQRDLFRRWTTNPTVHPHEALLGILALLHDASSREVRLLRCDAIDPIDHAVRLGHRPHPVPLDPASWSVLQRCLTHREQQHTDNPHVVVTRGTRASTTPASTAYFSHLLDPSGITPRTSTGSNSLASSSCCSRPSRRLSRLLGTRSVRGGGNWFGTTLRTTWPSPA